MLSLVTERIRVNTSKRPFIESELKVTLQGGCLAFVLFMILEIWISRNIIFLYNKFQFLEMYFPLV